MSLAHLVKRYSVLIFYILTFLVSWSSLLIFVGADKLLGYKTLPAEQMPLLYLGMLLGPTIAGLVMIGFDSGKAGYRELFRRLRTWRVPVKWYAIALFTAPLLLGLSIMVLSLISSGYLPSILTAEDKITPIVDGIIAAVLVGIFEELGWIGFVLPRLRKRFSMLATGLIMGFLWGLWHLPLFLASVSSAGNVPKILYLAALLFTVLPAYRMLMVWVYDNTQSLLLGMLMHMSQTALAVITQLPVTGWQAVIYNLMYTAELYIIVIVVYNKPHGKHALKSTR